MNQDLIFKKKEGDNWFIRNKQALLQKDCKNDWPLRLIVKNKIKPKRVLEIGASNGWRLAEIYKRYRSRCLGIEPSQKAIREGRKMYPNVYFRQGLMNNLPIKNNEKFDLVIIHFVLHWVDRKTLFDSIKEANRVLKENGYLIITDFLPDRPTKVFYHHLPKEKVFTYKLDYAKVFLSSGLYRKQDRVIFHHNSLKSSKNVPLAERAACYLLQKISQYQFPIP